MSYPKHRAPLPPGAWQPSTEPVPPTWAIASDHSEVLRTDDGFGIFKTEEAALVTLIDYLEVARSETADRLAAAKRRLRTIRRKT